MRKGESEGSHLMEMVEGKEECVEEGEKEREGREHLMHSQRTLAARDMTPRRC